MMLFLLHFLLMKDTNEGELILYNYIADEEQQR